MQISYSICDSRIYCRSDAESWYILVDLVFGIINGKRACIIV